MDYYTIMESRIKYFEQKYDPENKYGPPKVEGSRNMSMEKPPLKNRILNGFSYLLSILF
jgi:hypothetical protein